MIARALLALLVLGGCAGTEADWEARWGAEWLREQDRAFSRQFAERPFAAGPVAVVAAEAGEPRGFVLAPCRGGGAVCAGGEGGPAGALSETPDWLVVTGLYGRTFWLSRGGDAVVARDGRAWRGAWDSRPNGTGIGADPALESGRPHG